MRHVRTQISAYADGLLSPSQMQRVRDHLAICADCRLALNRHEQLARDLRFALKLTPHQEQITRWWNVIQVTQIASPLLPQRNWWVSTAALPTLLAVCILVLPMVVSLTGQFNRSAFAAGTYSAPSAVVTNLPPTDQHLGTQKPLEDQGTLRLMLTDESPQSIGGQSTAVSVNVTPAPVAP